MAPVSLVPPGGRRWARRLAAPLAAAALCALLAVLRRWRRVRCLGPDAIRAALPPLPVALVEAVRGHKSAIVLSAEAVMPASALGLADLLRLVVHHAAQAVGADAAAQGVEERLAAPDLPLYQAEVLVGDACAALGRERVWRSANAVLRKRGSARAPGASAPGLAARRFAAVASVPFTAVVADAWSEDLEAHFPHQVGRNFGGFAAVLGTPRVDAPPSRARPVLQLWPGLLRERGAHAGEGPQGLPASCAAAEEALSQEGPYLLFLRDLLRSKAALFAGWAALPPAGHLGAALRRAWRDTRAHDASRTEPLAYALAPGDCAGTSAELLDEYGLCVLQYDAGALGESGLEECFRALAAACGAQAAAG